MSNVIQRSMFSALVLTCAVSLGMVPRPVAAQSVALSGPEFPSDESYLRLLAPGNEAYRPLDGHRMKRLVDEQTAIARRYRDAGHQYWRRIIGTAADHDTASWMAERLRQAGGATRPVKERRTVTGRQQLQSKLPIPRDTHPPPGRCCGSPGPGGWQPPWRPRAKSG